MTARPRIARFSLTTADAERLAAFYGDALGFERVAAEERGGRGFARLMGIDEARARVALLRLGRQEVELVAFAAPGEPYPAEVAGNDLAFQHMAIVVSDMQAAYARLREKGGWTPITRPEPQRLPASSGGVAAFKFRDPEGHPLELLEFPAGSVPPAWQGAAEAGPCLGIDHSAISVRDTARSVAFYERLGFAVTAWSLNRGIEQERLDGVPGAVVEVTALGYPGAVPPHLELLSYRIPAPRPAARLRSNDVAATRLVLEVDELPELARRLESASAAVVSSGVVSNDRGRRAVLLRDPDGHALCLLDGAAALADAL
ncbi:MAG TPA: VOC family protein [Stellaceae bacterium]|nr:VOC family protein [Stellaceae bacterium]